MFWQINVMPRELMPGQVGLGWNIINYLIIFSVIGSKLCCFVTDVDHTCYTMTTAGSDGFCRMLPIYMDHVFFPILSVRI